MKQVRYALGSTPTYGTRLGPDPNDKQFVLWRIERPIPNPRQILPLGGLYGLFVRQIARVTRYNRRAARESIDVPTM